MTPEKESLEDRVYKGLILAVLRENPEGRYAAYDLWLTVNAAKPVLEEKSNGYTLNTRDDVFFAVVQSLVDSNLMHIPLPYWQGCILTEDGANYINMSEEEALETFGLSWKEISKLAIKARQKEYEEYKKHEKLWQSRIRSRCCHAPVINTKYTRTQVCSNCYEPTGGLVTQVKFDLPFPRQRI